jgi:hypothetical protein
LSRRMVSRWDWALKVNENRQMTAVTSIVFSLILVIFYWIDVAKIGKKF